MIPTIQYFRIYKTMELGRRSVETVKKGLWSTGRINKLSTEDF